MWSAQQHYPCSCVSPSDARVFCADQLNELLGPTQDAQDIVDAARLIVSELITNAVNAACSSTSLTITCDGELVRIAVLDDAPGLPSARTASERDEHGRGLAIIDALAADWGVVPMSDDGKQIWAELALPAALAV